MRDEHTATEMFEVVVNGKWRMWMPPWRAARPEWDIENGGWEVERLDAMHDTVKPGDIVWDIGAEEGDMSCLLSMWSEGGAVLFEPNPKVWPCTRMTFQANGQKPVRWFVGFASASTEPAKKPEKVWDHEGWPSCAWDEPIPAHGFRHLAQDTTNTPQVKIDDFCSATTVPDVITMDVEGSELHVLQGARQTLLKNKPTVFVSVHPTFMLDLYDQHPGMLLQYMADLGYTEEHLATDHEEHWVFRP